MKTKILAIFAVGLLAGPMAAHAVPLSSACVGSLSCFTGVDAGTPTDDPSLDPSLLPRTNATAAQTAFLGQLTNVRTQTFESATLGSGTSAATDGLLSGGDPLGVNQVGTGVSGSNLATGIVDSSSNNLPDEYFGRFNTTTSAGADKWLDFDGSINLVFGSPASGFGFFATDVGDFEGLLRLSISFVGGDSLVIDNIVPTATSPTNGSLLFFGILDSSRFLSSISISVIQNNTLIEVIGLDDLVVGDLPSIEAPEPGTLALFGFGLVGLGFARRRKRN